MAQRYFYLLGKILLCGFALIGFALTAGFFAVKFHLTDTAGGIDLADRYFSQAAKTARSLSQFSDQTTQLMENICRAQELKKIYPDNGSAILNAYTRTKSGMVLAKMLSSAERIALTNEQYKTAVENCRQKASAGETFSASSNTNLYKWIDTEEWQTLKAGLAKENTAIDRAAAQTGVPARLIVAQVVGEQLRLFHSDREIYKQFFQPLKILGNEVQFSLGVAGIKEETAKQMEKNLTDRSSVCYLGPEYEHLLDFKTLDPDQERFVRLTDNNNHYYSYLYTAIFIKQIEEQWKKAGYDISDRPEVLATIFNIGFLHSTPKADPQVGGSEIEINGQKYTFGSLAYEFYYSGEMQEEFPL